MAVHFLGYRVANTGGTCAPSSQLRPHKFSLLARPNCHAHQHTVPAPAACRCGCRRAGGPRSARTPTRTATTRAAGRAGPMTTCWSTRQDIVMLCCGRALCAPAPCCVRRAVAKTLSSACCLRIAFLALQTISSDLVQWAQMQVAPLCILRSHLPTTHPPFISLLPSVCLPTHPHLRHYGTPIQHPLQLPSHPHHCPPPTHAAQSQAVCSTPSLAL